MNRTFRTDSYTTGFVLTPEIEYHKIEGLMRSFVDHVRVVATEREIELPKQISFGGSASHTYISHKRKIVRELVRELAVDFDGIELTG